MQFNPEIVSRLNDLSQTYLAGHHIFNKAMDDAYLAKRFSKPDSFPHNVTYGISAEPKHLHQYYTIREQAYKEILRLKEFDGSEEYADLISHLYLVKNGDNCVGGVRLTISSDEEPVALPLETNGFSIKQQYNKIDFNGLKYCEASRLALLPEFRQGRVSDELILSFTKFLTNDIGVSLGFGRSTAIQARRFKSQFQNLNLGYKFVIRHDIKIPYTTNHDDLELKFWAIDFTQDQRYAHLLDKNQLHSLPTELAFA